jgi:hypothetical protein
MADGSPDQKEQIDFLWKVHSYTNDYIRFADQKAGLLLAVQSGLVAALYSAKLHLACSVSKLNYDQATAKDTLLGFVALLAFAGLLVGIACALFAIVPRLWVQFRPSLVARLRNKLVGDLPKGPIFWKQVLLTGSSEEYVQYVEGLSPTERVRQVGHHIHALAGVANAKFDWINLSVAAGALGAFLALIGLFVG